MDLHKTAKARELGRGCFIILRREGSVCLRVCVCIRVRESEKQMEKFSPYIWSVALVWTLKQISIRFLWKMSHSGRQTPALNEIYRRWKKCMLFLNNSLSTLFFFFSPERLISSLLSWAHFLSVKGYNNDQCPALLISFVLGKYL